MANAPRSTPRKKMTFGSKRRKKDDNLIEKDDSHLFHYFEKITE